ncbi:MAG: DUF2399 domain-containing protein [Rhodospirillales bacterium]|nr:DUF2399 domain-containing protein [Rhodospirillales bacterium]
MAELHSRSSTRRHSGPASAIRRKTLALAQARLCCHRDFDWPGPRIGNHVMREHGAVLWRFDEVGCMLHFEPPRV